MKMRWGVQKRGIRVASLEVASLSAALGLVFAPSGCAIDDRKVGLAKLLPDAADSGACSSECPEVLCPADDVCRDYVDVLPRGSCDSSGDCSSVTDCSFTWKPEMREGAACSCDAAGCRLAMGEACTRPDQCESDSCVATAAGDNVCCAAACGPNGVCAPDASECVAVERCNEDERRCSGAVYQRCLDGAWEEVADCGELGCSLKLSGCLRSPGQTCEADADCGVGSCLPTAAGNSVCCSAACDTSCRRCTASGTACEDIADDDACGTIECPEDRCRNYTPPKVTANRCAAGQCATPAQACTAFEPWHADVECSPTALCDAEGNCSRPKKDLLAPCSAGAECSSGACVANASGASVCCGEPCGANEICSAAGSCAPAPVCEDGTTQCSGADYQRCTGGQWWLVRECGALGCSVARQGCFGAAGDACASDTDCGAGTCQPTSGTGSVCCTAACVGACRRCASSGTACEDLEDDAACGVIACPDDWTCRDFPASVASARCLAGRCGSAAQLCVGAPRNAGQVCSATSLCDDAGNCSAPKKAVGTPCVNGDECALGNCVDGVCCNSACSGVCSTCATTGICRAPVADPDCPTGSCASQGVCVVPAVICGAEECPISGAVCCSELSAASNTRLFCEEGSEECPAPPAVIPDIPINCDEHVDCLASEVCCMAGTSTSTEVSCKNPQPTKGTDESSLDFASCAPLNPMLFGDQLCFSPAGSFQCPPFEVCESTNQRLPGFAFCRPDSL